MKNIAAKKRLENQFALAQKFIVLIAMVAALLHIYEKVELTIRAEFCEKPQDSQSNLSDGLSNSITPQAYHAPEFSANIISVRVPLKA